MWIYKLYNEKTRTQVPKFWVFLRQNHSLIKWWLEDIYEDFEDRFSFFLRTIKFIST